MAAYTPAGAERFRLYAGGAANPAVNNTGLASLSTPSSGSADEGRPWHPSSPLFAFAGLGLLTFGLMAFSTSGSASVRLGKLSASVGGAVGGGK